MRGSPISIVGDSVGGDLVAVASAELTAGGDITDYSLWLGELLLTVEVIPDLVACVSTAFGFAHTLSVISEPAGGSTVSVAKAIALDAVALATVVTDSSVILIVATHGQPLSFWPVWPINERLQARISLHLKYTEEIAFCQI